MDGHCGLVNPGAACTCAQRIRPAVSAGRVHPQRLLFAATTGPAMAQMEHLHATAAIFRAHPRYAAPARVVDAVRVALGSGRYPLITADETAARVEP